MSDSYKDVESRVTRALKAMDNDLTPNISRYSRAFCVPYHCLYHRKHGRNSCSTRSATNRKLTEIQKKAVLDYMTWMNELFMPLTLSLIKSTANLVLRVIHDGSPETASQVDSHWITWFKKRHPEFYEHTSHSLKIDKNVAQNEDALKFWFEVFN